MKYTEIEPASERPYRPTKADLVALLVGWQLDAVRILSLAEDLSEDALDSACQDLFGEDGPGIAEFIIHLECVGSADDELWNQGCERFLADA